MPQPTLGDCVSCLRVTYAMARDYHGQKLMPIPRIHPLKSCQDIHRLIFASQDRSLLWHERLIKKMHLGICQSCVQVQHNVFTLRSGLQKWRAYTDLDN